MSEAIESWRRTAQRQKGEIIHLKNVCDILKTECQKLKDENDELKIKITTKEIQNNELFRKGLELITNLEKTRKELNK